MVFKHIQIRNKSPDNLVEYELLAASRFVNFAQSTLALLVH